MADTTEGWGSDTLDFVALGGGNGIVPASVANVEGLSKGVPAVAWVSAQGVEVQFFDALGELAAADTGSTGRALVSEGGAGKSNVQIADAIAAYGVAWQESDGLNGIIKLRGIPATGAPFGTEITVGKPGFNNHSFSLGGYDLSAAMAGTAASGINITWVESAGDDTSGFGRIMLQRYQVVLDDAGDPTGLLPAGISSRNEAHVFRASADALAVGAANDNALVIAESGRDPAVASLHGGDTLLAWIGSDNHVHGTVFAPADVGNGDGTAEYSAINAALADLGEVAVAIGGARRLQVSELGVANFAVMWIALGVAGLELHGSIFSKPSDMTGGGQQEGWTAVAVDPIKLPPGFTGQFDLSRTDGDNPGVIVNYQAEENGESGVFAVRVDGPLGRAPGEHALPSFVHTSAEGDHSVGTLASMVAHHADVDVHVVGSDAFSDHTNGHPLGHSTRIDIVHETQPTVAAPHPSINVADVYHIPSDLQRVTGNVGTTDANVETVTTPVAWGLTAEQAAGTTVAGAPGDDGVVETKPVVTATEQGFITAWEVPNNDGQTVAIKMSVFDALGLPTPVAGGSGTVIDVTTNADAGVAPAVGGLSSGSAAAWVTSDTTESHLTVQVFDSAGTAVGTPVTVTTAEVGTISDIAMATQVPDPVAAPGAADQVSLVWVQGADADGVGHILLQRYAVPADEADNPQAPVAVGIDGTSEGDNEPEELTDEDGHAVVGRDPQAAGLHDGQLAVVWVQQDNSGHDRHDTIKGTVINARGGRAATSIDLTDLMPNGVAENTKPILIGAGQGDIVVAWLEANSTGIGGFDVKTAVYKAAGENAWTAPTSPVVLQHFAEEPREFSVVAVGATGEDLIVTWRDDGHGHDVHGHRYTVDGTSVGTDFDITNARQSDTDSSAVAGMLDGRFAVVYTEQDGSDVDIKSRMFDVRSAEQPVTAANSGGHENVQVGTIFDDIVQGQNQQAELHGGLGDDFVIAGNISSSLFGEDGNDTLIGGAGSDKLSGGAGNDLLAGGYGRDYISGGDGTDTISYRGEARGLDIDLAAGEVHSDPLQNGVVLPDPGTTINGLPAGALTDAGLEDLIGQVVEVNHDLGLFEFHKTGDIENAEGGLGDDVIKGTSGANVLTGGGGDDLLDGRGGDDTAVFKGVRAEYVVSLNSDGSLSVQDLTAGRDGTDTIINIEHLQFADGTVTADPYDPRAPLAHDDSFVTVGDEPVVIDPLANDLGSGLHIAAINGLAISSSAPVDIGTGFVQLRDDGKLLFTPDSGFSGAANFSYTISNTANELTASGEVSVDVKPDDAPTSVSLIDPVGTLAENTFTAADIKLADIAVGDDGAGDNALALAGDDADSFKLIGNALYLKAGATLDFEAKHDLTVQVIVDGSTITPDAAAVSENSLFGTEVVPATGDGALAAFAPDTHGHLGFELVDDASGRFVMIGNEIVVANPSLLDFEGNQSHTIAVRTTDTGGLSVTQSITVNVGDLTGALDNLVTGAAPNTTIEGTSANDHIVGLAGEETFNGSTGNDILDGGLGKDHLAGDIGNDTYVVDNSGDKVTELSGHGTDTVLTSLSKWTLDNNLENLVFTDSAPIEGRGNNGNNTILGGAGGDTLVGGKGNDLLEGSSGNDTLTGNDGADTFVFKPGFGSDVIRDFSATIADGHDVIDISSFGYTNFEELQDAGALAQVGPDVVITLNPAEPAHSDKLTLLAVSLSSLDATDFKFI